MNTANRNVTYLDIDSPETGAAKKANDFLQTDPGLLRSIEHIHSFQYDIPFQDLGALGDSEKLRKLPSKSFTHINQVLTSAGIHHFDKLEANTSGRENRINFHYAHDRYHFGLQITNGRFTITRKSSTFENFVKWYYLFMPHAASLFHALSDEITQETGFEINPTMAKFQFSFLLQNFKHGNLEKRNIDVLSNTLSSLPKTSDEQDGGGFADMYRINLHLSKKEAVAGKQRNCWYRLEAPLNEAGQYLIAEFEMRGATLETFDESGRISSAVGFDKDSLSDYKVALESFLRNHAINNFLTDVTDGWSFGTARDM